MDVFVFRRHISVLEQSALWRTSFLYGIVSGPGQLLFFVTREFSVLELRFSAGSVVYAFQKLKYSVGSVAGVNPHHSDSAVILAYGRSGIFAAASYAVLHSRAFGVAGIWRPTASRHFRIALILSYRIRGFMLSRPLLFRRKVNSSLRRDKAKLHLPENLPPKESIFFQSLVFNHRREQLSGQRNRKGNSPKSFINPQILSV